MIKERILAFMSNRKNLITALIILGLVIAGFFFSQYLLQEKIISKEFVGSVQKTEGSVIFLKGLYIVPEKPELIKQQGGFTQDVQVIVNDSTEIVKTLVHMPTNEELKKTNGRWDPNKLPKEEVKGTVAEMTDGKQGLLIRVLTDTSIFKKSKFTAKRIEFTEQVYSD